MKFAVVTGSRAEFGLLHPLLDKIKARHELVLIATGSHLSSFYGNTIEEVERYFPVRYKLDILNYEDDAVGVSYAMADALKGFSDIFRLEKPDVLVILGDRYEILSAAIAAHLQLIPIAHIHGGEVTQGAVDDGIRHAITKLSLWHFTSTEAYRRRVIQLGEDPKRVINVGSLGIENIRNLPLLSETVIRNELGVGQKDYFMITYHPVTLEPGEALGALEALFEALLHFSDTMLIFTGSNADAGGRLILDEIVRRMETDPRIRLYPSLGLLRYLSAAKYSKAVIGNSSSGIIEIPSLHVPSVDIGHRQAGRLRAKSVLHASETEESIRQAIDDALSYRLDYQNPYEGSDPSGDILRYLEGFLVGRPDLKKGFYDII